MRAMKKLILLTVLVSGCNPDTWKEFSHTKKELAKENQRKLKLVPPDSCCGKVIDRIEERTNPNGFTFHFKDGTMLTLDANKYVIDVNKCW